MPALSRAALAALRAAGFTAADWSAMWGYGDGTWGGDRCGCPDPRCANGHHHDGPDNCICLTALLEDATAWRAATREPNSVHLTAPHGHYRHVTVTTPGALTTVSATAGGPRPHQPEETVIEIETRQGWTAAVSEQDGNTVIRIAKTAPGQAPETGTAVPVSAARELSGAEKIEQAVHRLLGLSENFR